MWEYLPATASPRHTAHHSIVPPYRRGGARVSLLALFPAQLRIRRAMLRMTRSLNLPYFVARQIGRRRGVSPRSLQGASPVTTGASSLAARAHRPLFRPSTHGEKVSDRHTPQSTPVRHLPLTI